MSSDKELRQRLADIANIVSPELKSIDAATVAELDVYRAMEAREGNLRPSEFPDHWRRSPGWLISSYLSGKCSDPEQCPRCYAIGIKEYPNHFDPDGLVRVRLCGRRWDGCEWGEYFNGSKWLPIEVANS